VSWRLDEAASLRLRKSEMSTKEAVTNLLATKPRQPELLS
jgi:hypothetical protein